MLKSLFLTFSIGLFIVTSACTIRESYATPGFQPVKTTTPTTNIPTPGSTIEPNEFILQTPSAEADPLCTPEVLISDFPGCMQPDDDYTIIHINGFLLNQRTYSMLIHASKIYGGVLDVTGGAITQGSYTPGLSASFGTHDGGGAVDLSVMYPGTYTVAYDEIDPLILALRTAGFAAWLRNFDELYPGSPIHIHAIAIGDRHLSPAAYAQLFGDFGYFSGYSGVPQENGIPVSDKHGGPVICNWMKDL